MTALQSENTIVVRNPRTGENDYTVKAITEQQLAEVCTDIRNEQVAWNDLGVDGRIEVLEQWKQILIENREVLLDAVSIDTGRRRESEREVDNIVKWITKWSLVAEQQLAPHTTDTSLPTVKSTTDYSPYPVIGIISPWNFPLSLSLMDAIPALLAGCAVVVKPSEVTPRFIEPLLATIKQVPELAKVFTYVVGAGDIGAAMIQHIDMVCFTGSTATGRKVGMAAAEKFIPAFLELGGKDPAIVTKTADIERATSAILVGSVLGAGHQCYSIERIYVAESIYPQFVEMLTQKAQQIKLNYPEIDKGEIGPLIFEKQSEIITDHIEDAKEKGATIHTGGKIQNLGGGLWCKPTVISDVDHSMKIMNDETFGPLMPIMPFSSIEEAIDLANNSPYGLSGAVFAGTNEEGLAIARKLDVGGISINDSGLAPFFIGDRDVAEKNAFKSSGLGGSRLGTDSIKRFVRKKALLCNHSTEASAWWYTK